MFGEEFSHGGWRDQRCGQVRLKELTGVSVGPYESLSSCCRPQQVCAHFQWQSKSIYDALESASSGNILHHISQWLTGEVVYGSDHPQAMTEGGGT